MGLAASQARLLFITSRQNDVSAQMQRVSNQNLVLARDEEEVSTKYNQMLAAAENTANTTKLVDTSSSVPTNLAYNYMMGGADMNNCSSPYLVRKGNQVVLDSTLASKLTKLGAESGDAAAFKTAYPDVKSFLTAVADADVAAAYKGDNTRKNQFSISDMLGLGLPSGKRNEAYSQFYYANGTSNSNSQTSENFDGFARSFDKVQTDANGNITVWRYKGTADTWQEDARLVDLGKQSGVTISDLYNCAETKDGMIYLGSAYGKRKDGEETQNGPVEASEKAAVAALEKLATGLGDQLVKKLVEMGLDQTKVTSVVASANKELLASYGKVADSNDFWTKKATEPQDNNWVAWNEGAIGSCMNFAYGAHTIVAMYASKNDDWSFCVNAGNYAKDLVDKVMSSLGTAESTSSVGKVSTTVQYTIKTAYFPTSGTPANTGSNDNEKKANYFAKIYEALCSGGWYVDSDANNMSKLQEKIKNGTYTINGQIASNSSNISEVSSSKTYTKEEAERYFDTEMRKINRKEKQLDQQMTKLQTEYSALTNDYNSVKSLLDANIQRSFTYCGNG